MGKIPAINYFLREPAGTAPTLILLCVGSGASRIKLSTGISIAPVQWDKERQRLKPRHPNASIINHQLTAAKSEAEALLFASSINRTTVTKDTLRKHLRLLSDPEQQQDDFLQAFERYSKSQSVLLTAGSQKQYAQSLKHLKQYATAHNTVLSFDSIDARFYDSLQAHFLKDGRFVNSTFNKLRKVLVSFLNWATDQGLNSGTAYKKFAKLPEQQTDLIALSEDELQRLRDVELSTTLQPYRDLFLIECYTGLRYSDLHRISLHSIKNGVLQLITTKTRQKLEIPLPAAAVEILTQRLQPGQALEVPSNQKFNAALKDIGRAAKLDDIETITRWSGGTRKESKHQRHELLTTHTGRRTFCTIALRKRVPVQVIMRITGHKTEFSFKKYLRITSDDISQAMVDVFQ